MKLPLAFSKLALIGTLGVFASQALGAPLLSSPPRLRDDRPVQVVPVIRSGSGPLLSLPPRLRPGSAGSSAAASGQVGAVRVLSQGRLCRSRDISGDRLADIGNGTQPCSIQNPVRVRAIGAVEISPPAIMDCTTALATKKWLDDSATPAWGRLGGGLARVDVSESFACPADREGSRSELHQTGQALDISGFGLRNGVEVGLAGGWNDDLAGQVLRKIHRGACAEFRVARSPDAGQTYRDHLHLDTGSGRRICR